jgi:hypothetical protein
VRKNTHDRKQIRCLALDVLCISMFMCPCVRENFIKPASVNSLRSFPHTDIVTEHLIYVCHSCADEVLE